MALFESQHPWELRPAGGRESRAVPTCQPLRLPFISLVYYVCVRFYLRFDFYIVYLLFPFPFSALFVRSACVSKFIFLFVSTVNLMCLWHVLTVSSWRGYRRGYWQFMLTFFFILYIHHTVGLFSSTGSSHMCLGKRPLTMVCSCSPNGAIHE